MKLLMYSEKDDKWSRVGYNIWYESTKHEHAVIVLFYSYKKLPPCNHTPLLKQGIDYYYLSWTIVRQYTHTYKYA